MQSLHGILVAVKQVFHLKIGCRMNRMQQSPFMSERQVRILQFFGDGSETVHHNLLTYSCSIRFLLLIISAGSNQVTVPFIRLRVTYQHNRKHIHLLWVKVGQCRDADHLFLTPCLTDIAHRSIRLTLLHENLFQAMQLPVPALALRVVDRRHKIGRCRRPDALLNLLPRGEQVGQGNHAEIMAHRRP